MWPGVADVRGGCDGGKHWRLGNKKVFVVVVISLFIVVTVAVVSKLKGKRQGQREELG